MEYNFSSLIERLNNINFGEDRRKGAIDTDKLPDKGFVIVNSSPNYLTNYCLNEANKIKELVISKYDNGKLHSNIPYQLRTKSITKNARIDDLYIFDNKKDAQQFLDNIKNKCVKSTRQKIGNREFNDYIEKEFAKYKIIPISKLKTDLYAVFGEDSSGQKSEEYVVCLFNKNKYIGTFVRVGDYYGSYEQLSDYENLRNAKTFASKIMAEKFIKDKKMKGFKATPLKEALKLQENLLEEERKAKEEDEIREKKEHEEYLKSDTHKKHLEIARKERAKQKEIREGTYKVTFYYSNSWLGSETFTVHAESIDDAFKEAKAKAIARDPYCTYNGYDQRLRFNKNHIRFVEE